MARSQAGHGQHTEAREAPPSLLPYVFEHAGASAQQQPRHARQGLTASPCEAVVECGPLHGGHPGCRDLREPGQAAVAQQGLEARAVPARHVQDLQLPQDLGLPEMPQERLAVGHQWAISCRLPAVVPR